MFKICRSCWSKERRLKIKPTCISCKSVLVGKVQVGLNKLSNAPTNINFLYKSSSGFCFPCMPKPIFLVAGSNPSRTDDGPQESIGVASASTTPPFPPFDHHMGNIDDSGPGSSLLYMNFDLNPVSTEHSGSTAVSTSSILLPDLGTANTTFSSSASVRDSNLQLYRTNK